MDREPRTPEPKPTKDVRRIVLTVLAIVAAAAVGVLVASIFTSSTPTNASTTTSSAKPVMTVTQTLATTPTPTAKASPLSSSSSSTTPTSSPSDDGNGYDGAENFVKQYYDLLPQNPDAAWTLLTPKAQAKSKGKENFAKFYAEMSDVRINDTSQDENSVTGTVRFARKTGEKTDERYKFTIINQDGKLMIDDFMATSN